MKIYKRKGANYQIRKCRGYYQIFEASVNMFDDQNSQFKAWPSLYKTRAEALGNIPA